jgi:vacuolar-type H+-ATPase subunit I/STV1
MAFKLSKGDVKDRGELVAAARRKLDELNTAIEQYNESVGEAWTKLDDFINDYNGALSDARDFVERVKDEFTTEYDEKSEKWQEGDRGVAARDWIDSFDNVELDDAELDAPEPFGEVTADGLETLENLDTEAAE